MDIFLDVDSSSSSGEVPVIDVSFFSSFSQMKNISKIFVYVTFTLEI